MQLALDAHLFPAIAKWINETFTDVKASSVTALGLRDKEDLEIYRSLAIANTLLITKDSDFKSLCRLFGPPPVVLLLSIGNFSNHRVRQILTKNWSEIMLLISVGESLIEIKES